MKGSVILGRAGERTSAVKSIISDSTLISFLTTEQAKPANKELFKTKLTF